MTSSLPQHVGCIQTHYTMLYCGDQLGHCRYLAYCLRELRAVHIGGTELQGNCLYRKQPKQLGMLLQERVH